MPIETQQTKQMHRPRKVAGRIGAALSATGLAAGVAFAGAATANAGAEQGIEPCSGLQPGTEEIVSGDVFVVPAEAPGDTNFAFRFGPTHGPAHLHYHVDWQNQTTGAEGRFNGHTLAEGDMSQINDIQPTGGGHITWQVTYLTIESLDRPDLNPALGAGCVGERHIPA